MRSNHCNQTGFTFAELAFSLLIMVIGATVLINHLSVNYQTTNSERDRVFAFSKAQAILSEIQNFVDRGDLEATDLDVLDDGIVNNYPLSIQTDTLGALVLPDNVVSGNMQRNGEWLWARRITVQPFAGVNNRNVRYVTVRVYRRDNLGVERALADLSAVVNSSGEVFPATQVLDVYLLAIDNIPGWWVFMDSMRPFIESMITDLETRNPGLKFRSHWITKGSLGRNAGYRPYTNVETDSLSVIPHAYHYPGAMPAGSASAFYYVPDNIKARLNVDGTERNGYDADLNQHPYALADFFNHGMRYPDELALWQARVDDIEDREQEILAAIAGGTTPPAELTDMSKEPTFRLFLEDLYSDPDKYKNALVMNLHGELLPMPALRNYSDPAKSQVAYPNLRVVTHPEELRTNRAVAGVTDPLRFRMYAFGHRTSAAAYAGAAVMNDPMVVEFVGVKLTHATLPTKLAATCTLQNIPGLGPASPYATTWQTAKHSTDSPAANEMFYTAEWVPPVSGDEGFTRVYLYNTPTACTIDGAGRGLANSERARLYQMEYIPCPVVPGVGAAFSARDLTSTDNTRPKNTARWTLALDPAVLTNSSFVETDGDLYNPTGDVQLQVRTRIATGLLGGSTDWQSSGTMWPTPDDPDNLSVTYAWWGDSLDDVPFTERAQFNGDPRHVPYKDCFIGDYANAYNWYHDDLNNNSEPSIADYTCISAALVRDRWAGAMSCDVPRYFQLLREGLVRSRCVYTTLTGWSYYYMGIGNDIGYDSANGYPSSIPSNMVPHGSTGSSFINTITGARRYVRAAGANYWWGIPWLGELVPDTHMASQWLDTASGTLPPQGNLIAGTSANQFYQSACNGVYNSSNRSAYGTQIYDHQQRTSSYGCTTFFNIGTSASTFQHSGAATDGTLTAVGTELADNYNMTVPTTAPVSRPFRINMASAVAEHWNNAPYTTRCTATEYKQYYSHAGGSGSSVIKLVDSTNANAAYVVVNGISNAVDNGTTFIAKYSLLTLVHTFFEAGSTTNSLRIEQLPRMEIESPTDITELEGFTNIIIQYGVDWTRWDGLPYAETGTFTESETMLEYVIQYSNDGGTSWRYVQDDTAATPGERPTDTTYIVADAGAGTEEYDWPTPIGAFPEGSYMLRVDCYRQGAQVHYSYHQTRLFIQR